MATSPDLTVKLNLDTSDFMSELDFTALLRETLSHFLSINELRRLEGLPRKVTYWDCLMLLCGKRPNL